MDPCAPTAIDLFAGPGGLTEGLKLAGFHVVAAVERDSLSAFTYQRNHSEVAVWRSDIRDVDGRELLKQTGRSSVDLVAGCPPCQGFSSVRTRNQTASVHDDRNDLIVDYVRLVRELRPRAIMLENVPRLRFDSRWSDALAALDAL